MNLFNAECGVQSAEFRQNAVSEKNKTEGQNEHKGCRMAIMLYEL